MLPCAIIVRFMSLSGPLKTVRQERYDSGAAALNAVRLYAEATGFSNVKEVDDEDFDGLRYTARTPGGRGGRNVAFGDFE